MRWVNQDLVTTEFSKYPENILALDEVTGILKKYQLEPADVKDVQGVGWFNIFFQGLFFRIFALISLMLLKYAEGSGCVSRSVNLIVKWLKGCIGLALRRVLAKEGRHG